MVASQVAALLLQLTAMAAAAVAVHRLILFGDTKPGVVLNFPFAAAEARYFTMGLLYIVLMIAILGAVMVPVLVIVTGGDLAAVFTQDPAQESGRPPWLAGWRAGLFFAAYMIGAGSRCSSCSCALRCGQRPSSPPDACRRAKPGR